MSSMTIDQLKKSLTEQGITLPASRLKKADYVKLYKQHSTLNDTLGDVYSSDDDNPPSKTGSHSVSSSTSPRKIEKQVEQLTDDELYHRLKEFDPNIGPVLKNTRRVYEKKLMKMLSGKQSNGYDSVKTSSKSLMPSADEYSDSDVEIISQSLKSEGKGRKSSVLRDSPKPSSSSISKTDIERPFSSNFEYSTARSSTPDYTSKTALPYRYSYIETVPKGSSVGYIDVESDDNFGNLRQRFTDHYDTDKFGSEKFSSDKFITNKSFDEDMYKPSAEIGNQFKSSLGSQYKTYLGGGDKYKSGLGQTSQYKSNLGIGNRYKSGGSGSGDFYTGTWEPNINRYLGTSTQKKITPRSQTYSIVFKYILLALLLFALLLAAMYIYKHWPASDPYKMLEDDAERTIESLKEGSGGY